MEYKYTNNLINESSPYLLQHAHNPVDWYPWSDEAFKLAKEQDKPVFLSVGYSTCHWCHVMEHESFENVEIAKIMNENFINIKVDREQRPDVDKIYMDAVHMMTGSGGWPMSVFLTPDGKPFYGGTYFPPEDMYGRPGFKRILLSIADAWKNKREDILDSAGRISKSLQDINTTPQSTELNEDVLKNAYYYFSNTFDPYYGGFGRAPKFPQPVNLSMLLIYWHTTGDKKALHMVETTLDAMASGGIYDHLGGGFHRYSTDAQWLVPHFEKMLYDQALISLSYIQAYQVTGKSDYALVAREIFDYVLRDMADPKGGFYSAEDADSEGKEGTFYLWEPDEVKEVLGVDDAEVFNSYYGVTAGGNFEDGKSILNINTSIEQLAAKSKKEKDEIEAILKSSREKLLEHRAKRPRPHLDDKVITAWNGLMISSLAYGGAVLNEQKYIDAAEKSAHFILETLQKDDRLMRFYRNGQTVDLGYLNDYAFTILGLLDLYYATFDAHWLIEAQKQADSMIELFTDKENGPLYFTGSDAEKLIVRKVPSEDGVIPSGNSAAAMVLLKLSKLTMNQKYALRADKIINALSSQLASYPGHSSYLVSAFSFSSGPTREIVIAGDFEDSTTREMLKLLKGNFLPHAVIMLNETNQQTQLKKLSPFVAAQVAIDAKTTAYVCENFTCKEPVHTADELKEMLKSSSASLHPDKQGP
ncbi:MAG: thioredoxin domain-containing protein [Planctomycetota bacterium]